MPQLAASFPDYSAHNWRVSSNVGGVQGRYGALHRRAGRQGREGGYSGRQGKGCEMTTRSNRRGDPTPIGAPTKWSDRVAVCCGARVRYAPGPHIHGLPFLYHLLVARRRYAHCAGGEKVQRFYFPPTLVVYVRYPHVSAQRPSGSLSESCPKIGDLPKSPFPSAAALVPSAGK